MKEKANLLDPRYTTADVSWYDDQMPVISEVQESQYVVVEGLRHEIEELTENDWLILRSLYPEGPMTLW